jgi:maleylacetate reductase
MNALAHAAEALYAPDTSPIINLMAGDAARALATALPAIAGDPVNVSARTEALYDAWLSGVCLGSTTMSLHHKLCHILGGTFNLPHAEVHTAVLPYVLAYNLAAAPRAREILSIAIGADDPASAIYALEQQIGVRTSLRDLGMPEDGIDTVVKKATVNPYANPRPVSPDAVLKLIAAAYEGKPPST